MRHLLTPAVLALCVAVPAFSQAPDPGRQAFDARCARCHGGDGTGGPMGPSIAERLSTHDDAQLAALIRRGFPDGGMPAQPVPDAELTPLVRFLRTIQREGARASTRVVELTGGARLEGQVIAEGFTDLQVRTADRRVHLLRKEGDRDARGHVERGLADLQRRPRAATATRRSRRSTGRPSRGWGRDGCSPCRTRGRSRARRWWPPASCT